MRTLLAKLLGTAGRLGMWVEAKHDLHVLERILFKGSTVTIATALDNATHRNKRVRRSPY